jgi:hypothetical protein
MSRVSTWAGLGGTGRWIAGEIPESFSETVLYLWPNGDAPFTAMLAKMQKENIYNYEHSWITKTFPRRYATITGLYTDSAMTAAYTSGGVAGAVLHVKMSEAHIEHALPNQQVLLRLSTDLRVDVVARVLAVEANGASSKLTIKLLEADDNGTGKDLSDCNTLIYLSNMQPQGGIMPASIGYIKEKYTNMTQIIRNSLKTTRTKRAMRPAFGGNLFEQDKAEALMLHSIDCESALLFGVQSETTDVNGEPLTSMDGIVTQIRKYNPSGFSGYHLSTDFSGATWLEGGEDWLNETILESTVFRSTADGGRDSSRKVGWTSDRAIASIQKLVRAGAAYNIAVRERAYGITVLEWILGNGVSVDLRSHPMFNLETTLNDALLITEPAHIHKRQFDGADMLYFEPGEDRGVWQRPDASYAEFLSDFTVEMHYPVKHQFLFGVGKDNDLS